MDDKTFRIQQDQKNRFFERKLATLEKEVEELKGKKEEKGGE